MRLLIFPFTLMMTSVAFGQLTVAPSTTVVCLPETNITAQISGDLFNDAEVFLDGSFHLNLTGTSQNISGTWGLSTLDLNGADFYLSGNLSVADNITFNSGIFHVPGSSKFVFTGTSALAGRPDSYIEGMFYSTSGSPRAFPVGTTAQFAPLIFTGSIENDREIGVLAVEGDPGISFPDDPDVEEVMGNFHWQIATADAQPVNAKVSLSLLPFTIPGDLGALVVQRDATSSANLGSDATDSEDFVASARPVTGTVVGVATTTDVEITIIDLITPFDRNDINDKLHIDNITSQRFSNQKVTLLDRYGVLVESWEGAEVKENIDYDFSKLGPGSYICVVEYTKDGKDQKKLQMVTVFKS